MSMIREFAVIQARKYGLRVFLSDSTGETALVEFEGWERVALPDGRVTDAIPLDAVPVHGISRGVFGLLEAFV